MAENSKISQIKLPNGSTYDIEDNTSGYITGITSSDVTGALGFTPYNSTNPNGYTNNIGTITSVKTTAGAHTAINVSSGAANFNVPTKTSHLTNDSGFLTSYTETDPTVPAWAKASTKPTYSLSEISNTDDLQTIEALSDGPGLLRRYYNGATQSYYWGLDTTHYLTKSDINFTDGTNGFTLTLYDSTQYWVTITPSVAFSELTSTPTTLSGYGITNAYTKTEIDGLVAGVLHYKGTKTSVANLPTTGNTTGDVWHITADGSEYAWDGTIWQELGTAVDLSSYVTTDDSRLSDARIPLAHNQALSTITGAEDLQAIEALSGTSGFLKKTAANTWTLDTNTYLTSYTETDPVFSASAAAGITSTDISNWNAKVSDDHKWGGVTLSSTEIQASTLYYVPIKAEATGNSGTANWLKTTHTPTNYAIARWNAYGYLFSTTPSTNDNSTKVATTAYVDAAIPKVYSSTNTGGYLTMATLPIYDGTVV